MPVYSSAGFPPCALCDFAIKLYNEKPVSDACLALQTRQNIDVNLLLFCIWVAASGRDNLTESELEVGMASSAEWQTQVVKPLRGLRGYLKVPEENIDSRLVSDLRRVIADSEIYTEKLELQMLGELIQRPATSSFGGQECADAAAENLVTYMGRAAGTLTEEDRSDLLVIWKTAFPGADARQCALTEKFESAELQLDA